LAQFLAIFNRLAGSSDEMGTFIKGLSGLISSQAQKLNEQQSEIRQKEEALQKAISELKISAEEKTALQLQISDLQHASARPFYRVGHPALIDANVNPQELLAKLLGPEAAKHKSGQADSASPEG
jgi:hypothetical protein